MDKIKAMTVGELEPGSRLPKGGVLAGQLGLSRNSLREAVRALTAMRIPVSRQGDGTYVSSLEPQLLLEALSIAADVSQGRAACNCSRYADCSNPRRPDWPQPCCNRPT
ncbi:FadR/GntR family transcriptional regulator [Streptomyces sp. CA-179760]|uniref:FadR/GntR family transcriptional regulator n=1 Tax=Streptomyces sp. CA-179760 TaxID=3240054 RepID=UPI003D922435